MILSLCLLLHALSPSSQEICSAPGTLPAPTLYLSQTSAQPGDSVQLQCFMLSQFVATRIIFCKDGEEVSSQRGSEKSTYDYDHGVSRDSSGNYTCGYEIKDSNNQVTRSQLSPAQRLSVIGDDSRSGSVGGSSPTEGPDILSIAIWTTRCTLVFLLLVSAPIITFILEKRDLPQAVGLEETHRGSVSILPGEAMGDPY